MTDSQKPREFWIMERREGYDLAFTKPRSDLEGLQAFTQTHVIEYSAFDRVSKELEREKELKEHFQRLHFELDRERDQLKAELEDVQGQLIISKNQDSIGREAWKAAKDGRDAAVDELRKCLEFMKESKGCWDAAYVEGLPERMNEARNGENVEILIDILDRRVFFALAPVIEALDSASKFLASLKEGG